MAVTPKVQLIITGVSGSGKTTVMESLLEKFPTLYAKPLQFTTRKPRFDGELDDYVFLTPMQFTRKLINGDFIEYIEYNKELYGIGRHINLNKSNIFIAEPVGRESLKKYFRMNSIPFVSVFIEIGEDEAKRRLEERGTSILDMDKREKDFLYFTPSIGDSIIDGEYRRNQVLIDIHKIVRGASKET